jgi:1-acyl-sn-glycerol-3-phosphate acyltransferase
MENLSDWARIQTAENLMNEVNDADGVVSVVGKKILETSKVKPEYLLSAKGQEELSSSRYKLNHEPGIIISNHPGYFDTFAILNVLDRSDVKIVVSSGNYRELSGRLGSEYFIEARDDFNGARSLLREVKEHVDNGGVVLIYPTGGKDATHNDDPEFMFERGLSVILKKCLKPSDMVYSFYIEPEDIKNIASERVSRHKLTFAAVALDLGVNINELKDEKTIRVDERYSTAETWQTMTEKEADLEEYFLDQFKSKK